MDPTVTDCERQPLLNGAPTATEDRANPRRPPLSESRRFLASVLLLLTVYWTWMQITAYIRPYYPDFNRPPEPITHPGEHIAWLPCGTLANRTLECANLTVPMDHFAPASHTPDLTKNFTIPLLRLRSPDPSVTTNLLLNPGGPGGSGTAQLHRRGAQLAALVGDGFHLLGFDPRGVNQSRPLASCYPTPQSRQELSAVRDKKVAEDSGELWAWTGNFARACADAMGEHGAYVNTPQTAADMNWILDAVGQRGLYYWGFSYGTLLGQTYATMFPERVERVIIDGVANQFDWYEEVFDKEMMTDTDRVLEGFVDECVKAGEEDCALAGLAGSKEDLLDVVVKGVAKLKDEPVGVYVNDTVYGVLDYWAVWHNGVFPALYRPAAWRDLASNLASLLRGNATAAFLAYGRERPWETLGDGFKFISLNDGTSGREKWPADRLGLVDQLLSFFNQTLFSDAQYEFYFSKQAWSIPRTHTYVPKKKVKTAHPLLLLSTTYDPVCPLVSARSASDVFEGSRIVEVKGYGHCSLAVPSICIARHVRDFLYEGKLPDEDVRCEPDGNPYFSKPEQTMAFVEAQSFGDEERRIRLAQQELARDSWLRPWRTV
jgi:pimeloyl-ACP methyl ester carboxylesterase